MNDFFWDYSVTRALFVNSKCILYVKDEEEKLSSSKERDRFLVIFELCSTEHFNESIKMIPNTRFSMFIWV